MRHGVQQQQQTSQGQQTSEPALPGLPVSVKLAFFEVRKKQGIMRPYEEKVFWEVWRIRLRLIDAPVSKAGVPPFQLPASRRQRHMDCMCLGVRNMRRGVQRERQGSVL